MNERMKEKAAIRKIRIETFIGNRNAKPRTGLSKRKRNVDDGTVNRRMLSENCSNDINKMNDNNNKQTNKQTIVYKNRPNCGKKEQMNDQSQVKPLISVTPAPNCCFELCLQLLRYCTGVSMHISFVDRKKSVKMRRLEWQKESFLLNTPRSCSLFARA